jgi:[acyl-carrier-protein] S-malonyltransferase
MQSCVSDKETAMRALMIHGVEMEYIEHLFQEIQKSLPEGEVAEIANINSHDQVTLQDEY